MKKWLIKQVEEFVTWFLKLPFSLKRCLKWYKKPHIFLVGRKMKRYKYAIRDRNVKRRNNRGYTFKILFKVGRYRIEELCFTPETTKG